MIKTFKNAVTKSKAVPGIKLKISSNDHFIVTNNGKRILVDTGCPFDINDINLQRFPGLRQHLKGACEPLNTHIDEFWGMEFLAQHKVLFDYQKETLTVADPNDNLTVDHPVAELPMHNVYGPARIIVTMNIAGIDRNILFDSGACIANYLTKSITNTEKYLRTVTDYHPQIGFYDVDLYEHFVTYPVKIGNETVSIPFGFQPAKVEPHVKAAGADGVIGIGLYEKFQILVDYPNRRLVLGKYE